MKHLIRISFLSFFSLFLNFCFSQIRPNRNPNQIGKEKTVQLDAFVSVQGKINIDPQLMQQMQREWRATPAQMAGSKIEVEVWQVTYQSTSNIVTTILLQKKIDLQPTYQFAPDGILYKIDGFPQSNNLVVIAFGPALQAQPDLAVKGLPNDGKNNSAFHGFVSDAKNKLINYHLAYKQPNIVYGIYSIMPNKTNLQQVDFTFLVRQSQDNSNPKNLDAISDAANFVGDVAKAITDAAGHVFDQTIGSITGLAKCVANDIKGIADATGFFINQSGDIFYTCGMGIIQMTFNKGDFPRMRSIRQEEYNWANTMIFNNSLPRIDRIKIFNFTNTNEHRFFTWPGVGDYIYMNIGNAFDKPMTYFDNNKGYPSPGEVFIHELTHVWQIGRYGDAGMAAKYAKDGGDNQANYVLNCGANNINSNFKIEQEATLVDRTYAEIYYNSIAHGDPCPFQKSWTIAHIRNNVPFDAAFIAAQQMKNYVLVKGLSSQIGNVDNAAAGYTQGNGKDGDGYFLLGSIPWAVVYLINKDGSIYSNWGEIRIKYNSQNSERGELGWPQTDIGNIKDGGSFQRFQHGFIYSSKHGTFILNHTEIINAYGTNKFENGALGYPVSDYISNNQSGNKFQSLNKGGIQNFEHGYIELIVVEAMPGKPNITANVHIYTMAQELASKNLKPGEQIQNSINNNNTSPNSNLNNVKPSQLKPNAKSPLPPRVVKQN